MIRRFLLAALLLVLLPACRKAAPATAEGLTKVTLQLNWFPEAEHGGYYHALAKGYYREAGLDVEIVKGGPNTPVESQTALGQTTFGITNGDKILSVRAEAVPLVGLLAPFQTFPRCIIVRDDSPVTTLAELGRHTLIGNQAKPYIKYLQHKHGLHDLKIIPYRGGMATFLGSPDYAIQGYVNSEPFAIERQGVKVRSLMLADDGFNPYASLLITSEAYRRDHPEIVRAMVQASQRGWRDYLADPTVGDAEIRRFNPEIDAETLAAGHAILKQLMLTDETETHGFGWMTAERWQTLHRQLVDCGVLTPTSPPPAAAFTTEFLAPAQ